MYFEENKKTTGSSNILHQTTAYQLIIQHQLVQNST